MRGGAMKILAIGLLSLSLWLLREAISVCEVRAAEAGKSQMRVSFGSTAGSFAPLWVAKDKGFFNDLGLNVEVIYARSVTGIQAMLAGETQAAYTGCTEIMTSRKSGSDLSVIGSSADYNISLLS